MISKFKRLYRDQLFLFNIPNIYYYALLSWVTLIKGQFWEKIVLWKIILILEKIAVKKLSVKTGLQ